MTLFQKRFFLQGSANYSLHFNYQSCSGVKVAWVVDMSHPYSENDPSCHCCWGILWVYLFDLRQVVMACHLQTVGSRISTPQGGSGNLRKKTTSLRMNKLQGEDRDTPQKLTWRWNIHILAIGALHLQKVNFCSSWKPCNHVSSPESVHFPGKTNVSFVQIFHVKGAGDFLEGGKNLPVGRQLN